MHHERLKTIEQSRDPHFASAHLSTPVAERRRDPLALEERAVGFAEVEQLHGGSITLARFQLAVVHRDDLGADVDTATVVSSDGHRLSREFVARQIRVERLEGPPGRGLHDRGVWVLGYKPGQSGCEPPVA